MTSHSARIHGLIQGSSDLVRRERPWIEIVCPKARIEDCSVATAKMKQRWGGRFRPRSRRQPKSKFPQALHAQDVVFGPGKSFVPRQIKNEPLILQMRGSVRE